MRKLFLFIFTIIELITYGQDPVSSQFFFNQLNTNPAFAGFNSDIRAGLNYRRQWLRIPSKFETYNCWGDMYIPAISGGLGIIASQDVSGEGILKTTSVGLIQSFEYPIPKIMNLRAGYNITGVSKTIDWNRLVFSDQNDAVLGQIYNSNVNRSYTVPRNFIDLSAGFTMQFLPIKKDGIEVTNLVGYSVSHLTQPNEALSGAENKFLPRKHTFHLTLNFHLTKGENPRSNEYKSLRICPNIIYERQGNTDAKGKLLFANRAQFSELNFGIYVMKDPILGGIFVRRKNIMAIRENDCVIIMFGLKKAINKYRVFRFSYSIDIPINDLAPNSIFTHEISVSGELDDFLRRRKISNRAKKRQDDCYDFGMKKIVF